MKKSILTLYIILFCNIITAQQSKEAYIEQTIDSILAQMTIQEKIGQCNLRGTSSRVKGPLPESLKEKVRNGDVGAMINVMNPLYLKELQRIAVEESRLGIPLIFGRDVIHGFKTIFPIPLGQAASWDPGIAYKSARISAIEASAQGIRWTFAPMLDITRDSRWGRIAESPGEDPYLASLFANASIKGFHGNGLNDPMSMAACAKHFIAYGAPEGGRDYNTVVMNESLLKNVYAAPFREAVRAGVPTMMTSFSEVNGIPVTGNKYLLDHLLRSEMKFDGFIVSDWNSVIEMIPHGFAQNEKQAALLAANAGLDMEMMSKAYEKHLKTLVEEGLVLEEQLDFLVRNILKLKLQLDLFDNPYYDSNQQAFHYHPIHLDYAKEAAIQGSVLLKNNQVLPLNKKTKVALIGPLANAPREQLGTWTFDGEADKSISTKMAFENAGIAFQYIPALKYSRDLSTKSFKKACKTVKKSDVIVFVGGEEAILSGEAHSRADISLPGKQEDLIKELAKTGKPIILVIMAGRPISIMNILDDVDAVLMMWHPGTMGGPALVDMLQGITEPSGRLPVTWPKSGAQCPIYYNQKNTGRPADSSSFVQIHDIPVGAWQSSLGNDSHYLDLGFTPQFPFGYGLSYSSFSYDNLNLSASEINRQQNLEVSIDISNTGKMNASEVVQFYVQDIVGSITRPVKELKGFKKISLSPGETKTVKFIVKPHELGFYNYEGNKVIEPGEFNIWVGPNSAAGIQTKFTLTLE